MCQQAHCSLCPPIIAELTDADVALLEMATQPGVEYLHDRDDVAAQFGIRLSDGAEEEDVD